MTHPVRNYFFKTKTLRRSLRGLNKSNKPSDSFQMELIAQLQMENQALRDELELIKSTWKAPKEITPEKQAKIDAKELLKQETIVAKELLKQEKIVAKKAERESKLISSAVLFAEEAELKQVKRQIARVASGKHMAAVMAKRREVSNELPDLISF